MKTPEMSLLGAGGAAGQNDMLQPHAADFSVIRLVEGRQAVYVYMFVHLAACLDHK